MGDVRYRHPSTAPPMSLRSMDWEEFAVSVDHDDQDPDGQDSPGNQLGSHRHCPIDEEVK